MATIYWRGDAPAVSQVRNFLFAGTWEVGDVITLTIGGKTVTVVVASTVVNTIVSSLVTTWNALSATLYPEFAELTASASTGNFILTADTAGKPFAVTIATTETGGGAADAQTIDGGASSTGTATTASSGPNDVSTAANYSGGAIPANGDTLFFQNSNVNALYGLDALASVTLAALYIDQSYTGLVGLPIYNADGSAEYLEYRARYFTIGATLQYIGRGEGIGSARLNVSNAAVATTLDVYATGVPETNRTYALQWKGTEATNVVNITKGTVGIAVEVSETATVATLRVGYQTNVSGDATVRCGIGTTLTTIVQSGGTLTTESAVTTATLTDGELIHVVGAMTALNLDKGACRYRSSGTLTTANVGSGGVLDFRQDNKSRTVTNLNLYEGSEYHDPNGTVTLTNGADLIRCNPSDIVFNVVPNRTWTPTTI